MRAINRQTSVPAIQYALVSRLADIACLLAEEGSVFNDRLLRQFEEWDASVESASSAPNMAEEQMVFLKVVAHTLGWLESGAGPQPLLAQGARSKKFHLPRLYLQCLLEAKSGTVSNVGERLNELVKEAERDVLVARPRRLLGVVAGLQTWVRVTLPGPTTAGTLDLETIQRSALNAGGRAMWTALGPLKLYGMYRGLAPRAVLPPIGSAVSRGIQSMFGLSLSESGNDYEMSHSLHLKLADLAQASIWDINSAFYRIGGGT